MSNEPSQQTQPTPQQKSNPAGKGCAGCLSVIILLALIGWIADMAGCDSQQDTAQKEVLKALGPDNAIAKRIQSLSRDNAYQVGVTDGANDSMKMSVAGAWDRYDYRSKLQELRDAKSAFFDLLATQNQFDAVVLQRYRQGWDYGASTLSIH